MRLSINLILQNLHVCVCVCLSVCVSVCLSVCLCVFVRNRLPNHAYYGDKTFKDDLIGLD